MGRDHFSRVHRVGRGSPTRTNSVDMRQRDKFARCIGAVEQFEDGNSSCCRDAARTIVSRGPCLVGTSLVMKISL